VANIIGSETKMRLINIVAFLILIFDRKGKEKVWRFDIFFGCVAI